MSLLRDLRVLLLIVLLCLASVSATLVLLKGNRGNEAKAYLGVTEVFDSSIGGMAIRGLDENGPAAAAGVGRGDVIQSIDGVQLTAASQLRDYVMGKRPGDRARVSLLRFPPKEPGDRPGPPDRLEFSIALGETDCLPVPEPWRGFNPSAGSSDERDNSHRTGIHVAPISTELKAWHDLKRTSGIIAIPDRRTLAPATIAGLQEGDIILSFDGKRIAKPTDFHAAVTAAPIDRPIEIRVQRCTQERTLALPPIGPNLPGANLTPPRVREALIVGLDSGGLAIERLRDVVTSIGPRFGTLRDVSEDSIVIASLTDGELRSWRFAPNFLVSRGGRLITVRDLKAGEIVEVLSRDGTAAFQVISYAEPIQFR